MSSSGDFPRRFAFLLRACAVVLALGAALRAGATEYSWNVSSSGNWSDASNWNPSTAYPNATTDDVKFSNYAAGLAITLTEDINVRKLYVCAYDKYLNLNGHALTLYNNGSYSYGLKMQIGTMPTKRGEFSCSGGLFVRDGTMNMLKTPVLAWDSYSRPYLHLSNVAMNGGFNEMYYTTRIILSAGSAWTPGMSQDVGTGYYRPPAQSQYSLLCVTGATSRIVATNFTLNIRSNDNGLFVQNGAEAAWTNVLIGGTFRSTNCIASVDNATLTVGNEIQLGSDAVYPGSKPGTYWDWTYDEETGKWKGSQKWFSDVNATYQSELEVAGEHALVTAENLTVYRGTKAIMTFGVPTAGFTDADGNARAPIQVTNLAAVARNPLYVDSGSGTLKIACFQWARTHAEQTIPLIAFETVSAAALDEITNTVVWSDYPDQLVTAGKVPTISLASDGKSLQLTAPVLNFNPTFTVTAEAGTAAGNKTIRLNIIDYGALSESFTKVYCWYADNPELTGSTVVNLLDGKSPIATAVPCVADLVLNGGFVEHATYYARVRCVNENNYHTDQIISFDGDTVTQTLWWKSGLTAGIWQDESCWTTNGTDAANTYPRVEDSIRFPYYTGTRTITLSDDAAAYMVAGGNGMYPHFTTGRLIWELNGHTMQFVAPGNKESMVISFGGGCTPKDDLEPLGPTCYIRNGTFGIPKPAGLSPSTFLLGAIAQSQSGTLVLEDGATGIFDIRYFTSASRLLIRGGSCWRPLTLDLVMSAHTARQPYGVVCVTGETSRIEMGTTLTVRGDRAGLYVLDGGQVSAKNLRLGGTAHVDEVNSSVASTRTQIVVDDGTITLSGNFQIGWTDDVQLSPRLILKGSQPSIAADGALQLYEGMGTQIEYNLAKTGFSESPLVAGSLEFVALPEGNTDYGPISLNVYGVKAWARANPKAIVNLVQLSNPNGAGLTNLMNKVTHDWSKMPEGCLSVTAEGKILQLKAPPHPGLVIRLK